MSTTLYGFFATLLTAMVTDNPVFVRALGLNRQVETQDSVSQVLWYGGVFTWVSFLSTMGSVLVIFLVSRLRYIKAIRALGFLVSVLFAYVITYFLFKRFLPKYFEKVLGILPVIIMNTALFGIFYVIVNRHYSLGKAVAYALGTSLGYTLALLIMLFARKRLILSPISPSFRGMPIKLIYIGLMSLALYGLLGYSGA